MKLLIAVLSKFTAVTQKLCHAKNRSECEQTQQSQTKADDFCVSNSTAGQPKHKKSRGPTRVKPRITRLVPIGNTTRPFISSSSPARCSEDFLLP
jgi:hypothetical protein